MMLSSSFILLKLEVKLIFIPPILVKNECPETLKWSAAPVVAPSAVGHVTLTLKKETPGC